MNSSSASSNVEAIKKSIIDGNKEEAKKLARESLEAGVDPLDAIDAFIEGIKIVGDGFGQGEVFLPELIISAEAMKEAINILDEAVQKRGGSRKKLGTVIIGTVEGDIHDIGKTIVGSILSANGFEVIDLGSNVPAQVFVQKIKETNADIVGLSALLTTTMVNQKKTIEEIKKAGIRDNVKIIIGGAPTSASWTEEIGADGYGSNAIEALSLVKSLIEKT